MDRINGAGFIDLGGGKNGFRDENLATGVEGTEVTATWLNNIQEELMGMIEGAGLVPSAANAGQILRAIRGGKLNYAAYGGTGSALTLTLPGLVVYENGLVVTGRIPAATNTPLTLNVNGLGAKPCTVAPGLAVPSSLFAIGDVASFCYMDGEFRLMSPPAPASSAETIAGLLAGKYVTPAGLRSLLNTIFSTAVVLLYVRTDGNDANDGSANTAGAAFATIQGAINYAYGKFGTSRSYDVRLGNAGTYAAPNSYPRQCDLSITGDLANPANYVIATGASQFGILAGAWSVGVYGVTIRGDNTNAKLVEAYAGGYISLQNVRFTGTVIPSLAIRASAGSYVEIRGTLVFACSGAYACVAIQGGFIAFTSTAVVSYSGSPAYTLANMAAIDGGVIWAQAGGFTGTATGQRYAVSTNGVIQTGGGGINLFPGSVAGATQNGGQYV